jgi:hypothetical protein
MPVAPEKHRRGSAHAILHLGDADQILVINHICFTRIKSIMLCMRMKNCSEALAVGGHDGSYLVLDRVGNLDCVVGVRSPDGTVVSVYLMDVDIQKVVEFVTRNKSTT